MNVRQRLQVPKRTLFFVLLAVILAAFAGSAYGPALNLPFIGDDYVFLDETRSASVWALWSPNNTQFGWYRPWSREVHFWLIQRVAGLHEVAFRLAGLLLWLTALCLYAALVRRLISPRAAAIATLGSASLALWGTPLLWISGSQDLWMVLFAMAAMLLFAAGRTWLSAVPLGFALLSKETSAVLPALLGAYAVLVERRTVLAALRRTAHLWVLVGTWILVHPTLHKRLIDPTWRMTPEGESRPSQLGILAKTLLSVLNLDVLPRPVEIGAAEVLRLAVATAALTGGAWLMMRRSSPPAAKPHSSRVRLAIFGICWVAVGWFPLFLPSIGWHAYYGCLGALGAWFLLSLWLQDRPRLAVVTILCLAVLQWAHANTMSWDWGNEWYQRRAGHLLSAIRDHLRFQHASLPPHSRVYFGHIPNNIGLVAGQSPAIRVWYEDSTLQADFYSKYTPRAPSDGRGRDFFFRFDSLAGMVEVKTGAEDLRAAMRSDPNWEANHEALAMMLLRNGATDLAAGEFEKLSQLPHRLDAVAFATVCRQVLGDSAGAESLIVAAARRKQMPESQFRLWVARLTETFPGRRWR